MSRKRSIFSIAIVVCVMLLGACASQTPLEQLEESRSLYKATLNSFFVRETPPVEESPAAEVAAEGETAEGAAPMEADAAADMEASGEEAAPIPVRLDAVLDVIVQHDAYEPIKGITLDITMVDGSQNQVEHWLRWVDTEGLPKANQRPYSIVLEDVPYQEGYGFNVEVRRPVPVAERGDYREYDGL